MPRPKKLEKVIIQNAIIGDPTIDPLIDPTAEITPEQALEELNKLGPLEYRVFPFADNGDFSDFSKEVEKMLNERFAEGYELNTILRFNKTYLIFRRVKQKEDF